MGAGKARYLPPRTRCCIDSEIFAYGSKVYDYEPEVNRVNLATGQWTHTFCHVLNGSHQLFLYSDRI